MPNTSVLLKRDANPVPVSVQIEEHVKITPEDLKAVASLSGARSIVLEQRTQLLQANGGCEYIISKKKDSSTEQFCPITKEEVVAVLNTRLSAIDEKIASLGILVTAEV